MQKFFANFPKGTNNCFDQLPKTGKKGQQPKAKQAIPQVCPGQRGDKVSHSQVAPADGKAVIQVHPSGSEGKYGVGYETSAPPYRTQKTVEDSQQAPQYQSGEKPLGSGGRGSHPSSRRQREPAGRGSS